MPKTILRPGRKVKYGNKILFDHTVEGGIVFENEPTTPAIIPDGTRIKMMTPLDLIGGRLVLRGSRSAIGRYMNGALIFEGNVSFTVKEIRSKNWGTVLEY